MFLIVALLLLSLGIAFFVSIYSTFFPFMQNVASISQYTSAYYSALGSVERASLVLKYRNPGFEGSGGFQGSTGWGPLSDQTSPFLTGDEQGMWWSISSRTASIPASGEGNTDITLRAPDSDMYNMINYSSAEIFPLSMDVVTGSEYYYSGAYTGVVYFSGSYISGVFRLPSVVYEKFGSGANALLCATDASDCPDDMSGVYDQEIVSRELSGMYASTMGGEYPFQIIPIANIFELTGIMYVNDDYDNLLRAGVINLLTPLLFTKSFTPLTTRPQGTITGHNVISSAAIEIRNKDFENIFHSAQFRNLQLSFNLVSWLRSYQGSLYPYLEYRFTFPQEVSDRFFTIDAHGRNRNYDVQILLKKPTVQGAQGGTFTIIY